MNAKIFYVYLRLSLENSGVVKMGEMILLKTPEIFIKPFYPDDDVPSKLYCTYIHIKITCLDTILFTVHLHKVNEF